MARKLAGYVVVRDAKFKNHIFGPADDVPDWAVKLITLKSAWVETDDAAAPVTDESSEDETPKRRARATRSTS